MGGHGVAKRAGKIMEEEIVPVLEAAREAGVPVIHNEPRQILARYPWAEPPEPAPAQADNDTLDWPPPEFRKELLTEYHSTVFGAGYREPWSKSRQTMTLPTVSNRTRATISSPNPSRSSASWRSGRFSISSTWASY